MARVDNLNKLIQLHNQHENKLIKMSAAIKKKIEDETKKYSLLNNCLKEYREKLATQSEKSIPSFQYQQYYLFMDQLEIAIKQQIEFIKALKENQMKILTQYELVKNKIKNIKKLIDKEIKIRNYKQERCENQEAVDLYNKLKR